MTRQVDWLTPWKRSYIFRSSDDQKNKTNKKMKMEELQKYLESAIKKINDKTSKKKYKLSKLKWKPNKLNKHSFRLSAYLSPSVVEEPTGNPGPGEGDSVLSPKTPPQP